MTTRSCYGAPLRTISFSRLRLVLAVIAVAASAGAARSVRAQQTAPLRQLDNRVSPALRQRVAFIADSATAAGLPVGPLIDKALEGASKHADESRIVAAVHAMFVDLRVAHRALGASASEDELTAAVAALRAGVPASALTGLRRSLPRRTLTVPLSVLAALVIDGAPPTLATTAVVDNAVRGDDRHLLDFGRTVARSLAGGVPAPVAFTTHATTTATETATHPLSKPPPSKP